VSSRFRDEFDDKTVRHQNSIRPRNHNALTVKSELVPEARVMS
jgi:hypothetical protein